MPPAPLTIDLKSWLLLILLAVLWGCSYFFVGLALRELPPLTVVLARVALAAAMIYPVFKWQGGSLPTTIRGWLPFTIMGLFNNIIPFSLIFASQLYISSGLASVLNATTPLFAVIVATAFREERLILRRVIGVLIGLVGVYVLRDPDHIQSGVQIIGILFCLCAALSYGLASLWGRRNFGNVPPLTTATCQLISSGIIMAVIASIVEQPWHLPMPSATTWAALLGLAALSTALGYILFFTILKRVGPSNVQVVTLLMPVPAILLGVLVLGEPLALRDIAGALVIAASLLVVDGRVVGWAKRRLTGA
ncbi:MAG: DMT family transporter [Pseudolabrys sp.]|nr:DMT family transporter [Pseudolabrys sp.]